MPKALLKPWCNIVIRFLMEEVTHLLKTKRLGTKKVDRLALQGLRTLAFAYKETQELPKKEALAENLTFWAS